MITLNAKIELKFSSESILNDLTCNLQGNNISANIGEILGYGLKENKPIFLLGMPNISVNNRLYNEIDFFVGEQLTDENGLFANEYILTLTGENITAFAIMFDTINDCYPNKIYINDIEYDNDNVFFCVSNLEPSSQCTIKIKGLNKPSMPLRILGLMDGFTIVVNGANMIKSSLKHSKNNDNSTPEFGLVYDTSSIEINDSNKMIYQLLKNDLIQEKTEIQFYIENTISNVYEVIGRVYTNDWDYDNLNFKVKINMDSQTKFLQDVTFNRNINKDINFFDYLSSLKEKTKTIVDENLVNNFENSQIIDDYLMSINAEIIDESSDTLWGKWRDFCYATGLNFYSNEINTFKLVDDSLVNYDNSIATLIPSSKIFGDIENNKLTKNKIKNIQYVDKKLVSKSDVNLDFQQISFAQSEDGYTITSENDNYVLLSTYSPSENITRGILKVDFYVSNNSFRLDTLEYTTTNSSGTTNNLTEKNNIYNVQNLDNFVEIVESKVSDDESIFVGVDNYENCLYIDFVLYIRGKTYTSYNFKGKFLVYNFNQVNRLLNNEYKEYFIRNDNGLMNSTVKYGYEDKTLSLHTAEKIQQQWKNGKETFKLVCSVGEYYDENGNLSKSTKKLIDDLENTIFKLDDIVIPYKLNALGYDEPISMYSNDRPKKFRIVHNEIYYDGALWQKIIGQEI